MTMMEHVAYALLWLSFGALHSALADQRIKRPLQRIVGSRYRLAYNIIAALHVALIYLLLGRSLLASEALDFSLPQYWLAISIALQVVGVAIIVVALSHYDLGRFAGTTQINKHETSVDDGARAEHLHTGGLHRWVRHPLYLGVFLILWARVTGEFELATAIWASAYVIIGARLEEGRLLNIYGDEYAAYQKRVPMFLPLKMFQ